MLNVNQVISSICISSLTEDVKFAFDISITEVNLAISCSAAIFLPAFVVSTLMYNRYECRTMIFIAGVIMFVGAWTRLIAGVNNNFWWVVVGQVIIASSGPMVTSSISIIANNWFADD